MSTVTSKDGTTIAYDKSGTGPALILVDGALCFRAFGPMGRLSELLAPHFTVYKYDRRGRGESSSTQDFRVEREVEDLDALIQEAGGQVYLFGVSSGAALVLEAALKLGDQIKKIALYEAPYNADESTLPQLQEYLRQLKACLGAGDRGEAVALFMQLVGAPPEQIAGMRQSPVWPVFESVAPSLQADAYVLGEERKPPVERVGAIHAPVLVMDGGANLQIMPFMHDTAVKLAKAMPNAQQRTLEGQTHDVNLEVLAPELVEFFKK